MEKKEFKDLFDPINKPGLKDVNTIRAEQAFSWWSRYKNMCRSMGPVVYDLFVIGMVHERNKWQFKRLKSSSYIY